MKSLVIRAIELLELAQLGSALMISACTGRLQQRGIFLSKGGENSRRGSGRAGETEEREGWLCIKGAKKKWRI